MELAALAGVRLRAIEMEDQLQAQWELKGRSFRHGASAPSELPGVVGALRKTPNCICRPSTSVVYYAQQPRPFLDVVSP